MQALDTLSPTAMRSRSIVTTTNWIVLNNQSASDSNQSGERVEPIVVPSRENTYSGALPMPRSTNESPPIPKIWSGYQLLFLEMFPVGGWSQSGRSSTRTRIPVRSRMATTINPIIRPADNKANGKDSHIATWSPSTSRDVPRTTNVATISPNVAKATVR